MNYYFEAFKKGDVFKGRANRKEFWIFYLLNWIILSILVVASGASKISESTIAILYLLAVIVPSISVGVRRMHDVNEKGWYLFIPFVNFLLACLAGTNGDNKYGSRPTKTKNIRICTRCEKREGRWWDNLCEYCLNMPTSKQEALEYEKLNGSKDIIDFAKFIKEKEVAHDITQASNRFSGSKLKWIFAGLGIIILAGLIWSNHKQQQQERWECLKSINYRGVGSSYILDLGDSRKIFHTQNEALEYCLLLKKEEA